MDMLNNFKKLDSDRIEKLYSIVEAIPAADLDQVLPQFFLEYSKGLAGRTVIQALKTKIAKAVKISGAVDDKTFLENFERLELRVKQSLIVTMANDISRLGIYSESQIFHYIESKVSARVSRPPVSK